MNKKGFATKAIHKKFLKKDPHGSLHMPIYDTVSFEFETAEDIESAFLGTKPSHMYSRITNPTTEHFEQTVREVSEAFAVIAVSSGMAAIANLIITIAQSGSNIVTSKNIFGNTYSLFEKTLKPWGLETRYTDLLDPDEIERSINKNTSAIFLETITNPQLEVADIKAISDIAKKNNILLIADSTITPLYFYNPKELGIDIEVISSTKYISGGATSVGGLIIDHGSFDWNNNNKLRDTAEKYGPFTLVIKLRRESYRNLGSCLPAHNAYLQNLGLETLTLRIERSCFNTLKIAEFLTQHHKVRNVNYPGLTDSKYHKISKRQFGDLSGAILTFDMGSKEECFKFMNNLQLIKRSTNINDNKTLVIHPASTIFCEYSAELKDEMGVSENMVRLAAGIEEVDFLISDINNALEVL
ncbi:MAG: O-acetylhomoserine aminocarboxypropyltransferase/cysteine synthase [bacterium]|nr:O-acetylhomoserine aminocarboxypropyltransferase/cysteine synthase [bacterium]